MRIAFLDFIDWDYVPGSIRHKPMGGMQSAVCYLTPALAASGHKVYLLNNTSERQVSDGVMCIPLSADPDILKQVIEAVSPDVLIVVGSSSAAHLVRPLLTTDAPLILWTGHAWDQPHNDALLDTNKRDAWGGFAFCGSWQRETFHEHFQLNPEVTINLGYGIAPAFESLLDTAGSILDVKAAAPTLVYTSTPFRGLNVLVDTFPLIRARVPNAQLKVFSSMKVYQVAEENDQFNYLYEQCRKTEGIEYVGSIPQHELATELRSALIMAYPNTFAETGCIAVMEAMASGCAVVTTDLGALPETTAGFATLIPQSDPETYREHFVEAVASVLERATAPENAELETHLRKQVDYARATYNWTARAQQWVDWLSQRIATKA